ncbi:Helix-turn-helix, AraC domain protein OS=Tsukamurella paurometabola (strain ATCC 8368 / DSM/ CCUG 35730 / CIP 100753 / JCM 10117 / KCTC 9821 / NBRC 16120/ NCIMB 702349 / NCTC 13040) OX=521096 GN=Tpau_2893 PE=4 SV=1 [Tsukamurella paurometabola]|uniref:Helix-turn-helix, AraC domain protein n=1 Tax=Tsukamurella paurometabola (strain ATCC 8368 / DSM 20162 / CCUG 35730 / CIP 100753 / JCM 10117 / KCTC 9821 / NBRC 16120 / NCIMB 702349 / NCTC 13040) TaxID=521096 RepID=D5UTY8_TSUPD|nr:helix-turn-helix transcriptional regulator [Tsukamurella paurometabola]ADG79491.1 Helix-turn-helix, AraC domain protein [Tsukamurella paurometabola DSM 20162]SUP35961.1 DNA gyrase inhibitor [Tsukamurella paurometabola]
MSEAADPLRRLLEAVLAEPHQRLDAMAEGAHSSLHHFARQVRAGAGESPIALRRRVLLERAAWQLQRGSTVTDAAFAAGYESVEGFIRAFARAYGHSPSQLPATVGHWLPSPNGLHFHSPTVLYVADGHEESTGDVLALQVQHDAADTGALLAAVGGLSAEEYRKVRLPGSSPRHWDGPDESLAQVMWHLVHSAEPWLATVAGDPEPRRDPDDDPDVLRAQHELISPRWLGLIRDIERRGAWGDRVIDALCDPPESFLLSQIVVHELTFSTHRRLLARWMLADAGVGLDTPELDPDPIIWHRRVTGGIA